MEEDWNTELKKKVYDSNERDHNNCSGILNVSLSLVSVFCLTMEKVMPKQLKIMSNVSNISLQYDIKYNTMQYFRLLYGTVQYNLIQYHTWQDTELYYKIQYDAMKYNTYDKKQ